MKTPERTPPFEDSGEWTGERCPMCTYTTMIDADAAASNGANFCGACGHQLAPQNVLEIRERLPEQLEEAVEK